MSKHSKGGLWRTAMGHIVLDNHHNEIFSEPYDQKLMTAEELTRGIKLEEFLKRLTKR